MNEKIKNWFSNNWIAIVAIVVLICASIWFYSFHVPSDGSTIDKLRDSLGQSREQQQRATEYIDRADGGLAGAQDTAGQLSESNREATDAAVRIEGGFSDSQACIDNSREQISRGKSIIDAIREGTESDTK